MFIVPPMTTQKLSSLPLDIRSLSVSEKVAQHVQHRPSAVMTGMQEVHQP